MDLGTYATGEVPAPLVYTYLDANGDPIDLSGYQAAFTWRRRGGSLETRAATLGPGTGQVVHSWQDGDLDADGQWTGQFWAGNGVNRFASAWLTWSVRNALVAPPPVS